MLLTHRCHVIQAIKIRQCLKVGFVLNQLFCAAMQQADMAVDALNNLAVELHHHAQHAVGSRMLRPKVDGVIFYMGFGHGPALVRCF